MEIGLIEPTPSIVGKFFNDSTGKGDFGDEDTRGPWNEGDDIEYVEAPAKIEASVTAQEITREIESASYGGTARRSGHAKKR